tara:strand:- start:34 stop:366 length:333 start_codon:yes stop_codon:yes gene_type:complete
MKSKSFIQLILFSIIILSSFIVYQYFFKDNKSVKIIDSQPNEIQSQNSQIMQSKIVDTDNIIEKLEYKSIDAYGNEYVIKSSKAESQLNDSNNVMLFSVSAIIYSPKKNL